MTDGPAGCGSLWPSTACLSFPPRASPRRSKVCMYACMHVLHACMYCSMYCMHVLFACLYKRYSAHTLVSFLPSNRSFPAMHQSTHESEHTHARTHASARRRALGRTQKSAHGNSLLCQRLCMHTALLCLVLPQAARTHIAPVCYATQADNMCQSVSCILVGTTL